MKNIKTLLWCILAACVLCACDDEEKEGLTGPVKLALLTDSVHLLESSPQLINIKFQGSEAWEVVDADSLDSWCAIYPPAGDAGSRRVVSVTLPQNDTYEDRSATIVIRSGGEEVSTRIFQPALGYVAMQYDMLPGGSYAGGKIGVNGDDWSWKNDVACKGDWTIVDKADWIIIRGEENQSAPELEGGTGNSTLHVYAKPNQTEYDRDATFTVKSKTTEVKVTVYQAGPRHVTMQYDRLPANPGEQIGVNGDDWSWRNDLTCEGEWAIVDKADWIMIKGEQDLSAPELERGTGNTTLHIYAKPNQTGSDRNATFTVKSKTTEVKVTVYQSGKLLQYDMLPGGSWAGQKIGVNGDDFSWKNDVTCIGDWAIVDKAEWIIIRGEESSSAPRLEGGTGNFKLHVYAKPNKTGLDREGTFTVKSEVTSAKVTVYQAGK